MRSLTIGQIQGIAIKVHPTFGLVLLWLIVDRERFGSGSGAFLFGVLLTALVFGCVVLHELGHSVMAMQYGFRVHDITLWPMGGVARVESMPARPITEMVIAIAGPAVNVAIAVATIPVLALYAILQGYGSPAALIAGTAEATNFGSLLLYLLLINVMLVLFNMLPAFPMDGGRVLRAGLTLLTDRNLATRIAVWAGQAVSGVIILTGLYLREFTLPLVGLFVIVAARAEGRQVRLESAMRRLHVGQFALWDFGGIAPDKPLTHALRGGPSDVVVTDNGRVVGMLWRSQILQDLNGGMGSHTVGDVMDRTIVSVDVYDSMFEVQQLMHRLDRWALPVTEDGVYRGIFTADRFVHVYRHLESGMDNHKLSTPFGYASQVLGNVFRMVER
jgi:Zn-dependent protease